MKQLLLAIAQTKHGLAKYEKSKLSTGMVVVVVKIGAA